MGKIPDTAAARKALKVAEIKALLEEAGLATDGTKPTLLERLEEVRLTPDRIPNPSRSDPAVGPALTRPHFFSKPARREDRRRDQIVTG